MRMRIEIEGVEVSLKFSPAGEVELTKKLADGCLVVGYLVQDEGCENPCTSCDGVGTIRSMSRKHINNIDCDEAASLLESDQMIVPLSYYEHGLCLWDVCDGARISNCPDKQWDQVSFAGVWIPDDCCREEIKSRLVAACLPDGVKVEYQSKHTPDGKCIMRKPRKGEKPYFTNGMVPVKKYSNSITLTLPDGTTRDGFKSFTSAYRRAAQMLGVKIDRATQESKTRAVAEVLAAECCKTYTDWANGECYGIVVERFTEEGDRIDEDSCWGHIGSEYAREALKDSFDNTTEGELSTACQI